MTSPTDEDLTVDLDTRMFTLLEQSMLAWGVLGRVHRTDDSAILVTGLGREARVERAAAGAPFRWLVTIDGRRRPAVSVIAVLRQVRLAFDPGHEISRVRIGAMPVGASSRR